MNLATIHDLARLMRRRDLQEVEFEAAGAVLRLTIDDAPAPGRAVRAAQAEPPESPTPATSDTVRSPGIGILRLRHPAEEAPCVQPGRQVASGQIVAYLQVGDVLGAVVAPQAGRIDAALGTDGQLVGWGEPLFALRRD